MKDPRLEDAASIDLIARPSHELMDMQKKLMLFLMENDYQFVDEEGYIKVQISPLKIQPKPKKIGEK